MNYVGKVIFASILCSAFLGIAASVVTWSMGHTTAILFGTLIGFGVLFALIAFANYAEEILARLPKQ